MSKRNLIISIFIVAMIAAAGTAYYFYRPNSARLLSFRAWINNPASHPEWKLTAGSQCGSGPFHFPTDGFVGFLWGDSFRPGHRHQGIDIFAGTEIGVTPVLAAYPGYLTRSLCACPATHCSPADRSGCTTLTWPMNREIPSSLPTFHRELPKCLLK